MKSLTAKQREWQSRIEDYQASGLSQIEYCRRHGIKPKLFYNWKHRLKQLDSNSSPSMKGGEFIPVCISEYDKHQQSGSILLRVGKVDIVVTQETDGSLLHRAIEILEARQ